MRDQSQTSPTIVAYLALMRLDRPTGIWLLMWPCWWAVMLASPDFPALSTLFLFFLGAFLMRPVGCVINDIADRKLDAEVERTKNRPLPSGDVTVGEAVRLAIWLLFLASLVAWALGETVMLWAAMALPLVLLYPWMKRITWWPQLFLGLTFNWGVLLGWVAVRGTVELPAILLYVGGVFWTLGYDTIYACQDRVDDQRAGIKSTALYLNKLLKPALYLFYTLAICFWAAAAYVTHADVVAYGLLLLAWAHLLWQVNTVRLEEPESCRSIFASNATLGWLIFAAYGITKLYI